MLSIYVDAVFPADADAIVTDALGSHEVVRARRPASTNLVSGDVDPAMLDAHVWFGQPSVAAIAEASRLRWIHLTSAGYTRYAEKNVAELLRTRGVALTTSSTVYAEPCATHAFALLLALLRSVPEALADQVGARSWPSDELRARSGILEGRTVLVLGYGAIGRRVAEMVSVFRARPVVLRERVRGDEAFHAVSWDGLGPVLPTAHVVVNTLPESASTRGRLDGAFFEALPRGALFVNVGRGTTVDQTALLDALTSGRLAGAGLDVTDPEPLPAEHPLWSAPGCIVTPHSAGGRDTEFVALARHFADNLARFEAEGQLVDRVI